MRRTKRLAGPLLVSLVLAAAAAPKVTPKLAAIVSGLKSGRPAADPAADAGGGAEAVRPARSRDDARPVKVTAVVVTPTTLSETVSSTGTLLAEEQVELQAEVPGRITALGFEEGARVRRGDLLVKLGDADLQAARLGAVHELELARRKAERSAELLEAGFVRRDEYDSAVSAVEVLKARIALTEAEIAKTEIRAPFDGVAGLRYVSVGAVVNAATRIATVQRTDRLKVEFSIPERYAGRVRAGSPVSFTVAGRDAEFRGEVYALEPRIDAATRTLAIRALCANADGALVPGAFANVRLTLGSRDDALLIPAVALIPDVDSPYVFVLVDGKAERRPVGTGVRTDSRVQILSGLVPGDVVITTGLQQIRPGSVLETEVVGDATLSNAAADAPAFGFPETALRLESSGIGLAHP